MVVDVDSSLACLEGGEEGPMSLVETCLVGTDRGSVMEAQVEGYLGFEFGWEIGAAPVPVPAVNRISLGIFVSGFGFDFESRNPGG